jgi:AraC-like DNA-binding protein
VHVSTRYLHRLFADEGSTVSGWIRQRRLEGCRRDLADPSRCDETVTSIGSRWGLTSSAHLSRLFREAYGVSPTEYRAEQHRLEQQRLEQQRLEPHRLAAEP